MAVRLQIWNKTTKVLHFHTSRYIHVMIGSDPEQVSLQKHRQDVRRSQTKVLNRIKRNVSVMDQPQILKALNDLCVADKDVLLCNNPVFADLCQNLKKYAPTLKVSQVVEAIKMLSSLNVPVNTYIFQILLQMIRCNINLLDFDHIQSLDAVLTPHIGASHLVNAIKQALPLVFEIHFPLEFDSDHIPSLVNMLSYSCKYGLHECVDKIIEGFLTHNTLKLKTSKEIIKILCEYNYDKVSPNQMQLLHNCLNAMADDIYDINPKTLANTVALLADAILKKGTAFYHQQILDAAASVGRKSKFNIGVQIAVSLAKIRHTNMKLAEYLRAGLSDNGSWSYIASNPHHLFDFIRFLSYNNFADELKLNKKAWRGVLKNPNLQLTHPEYLHVCLHLASLNTYDDNLLPDLFSKDYDGWLDKGSSYQLLVLCEAVRKFHNVAYNPPINILEKVKEINHIQDDTIAVKENLERSLGDHYVQRNVLLPNGIFVDLVVCLRDGDKLVEMSTLSNTQSENEQKGEIEIKNSAHAYLELSRIPHGSEVVCILVFGEQCYSRNSNRLQGYYHLILRILEHDGYKTFAINAKEWSEMPECERTDYVMRELSLKCQ